MTNIYNRRLADRQLRRRREEDGSDSSVAVILAYAHAAAASASHHRQTLTGSHMITRFTSSARFTVALAIGALVVLPHDASAQAADQSSAPRMEDLRHRLEELERKMAAEIAAVRQQMVELEARSRPAPPPVTPGPAQAPAPDETFARDRESVARVDNRSLDPALQGFLAIPGTPARMKVDGYAKLDVIADTTPAGNPDRFVPSTIPVGLSDAQQTANSTLHVRQTRINLDFRSPTELGSDFRTFAEIDFFGPSGPVDPRMRHFFAQLANVLIGQTWTTFTDVDAVPDILDDGAPVGVSKLRQAQVRYTYPLRDRQSLAFAVERPITEARAITDANVAYSPAPDFILRYRVDASRGHLQAGSVFRSLGYRGSARNTTKLGVGVNIAGAWTAPNTDVVVGSVTYGRGIARYIDTLAGTNSDLDLDDDGTDVAALPAVAAYAAFTHFWPHRLRSTGTFGFGRVHTSDAQPASSFGQSYYVSANLLWNPAGSLNVGVEYLFGTHRVKSGADAQANRIQLAAKYDLFRKRPLRQ